MTPAQERALLRLARSVAAQDPITHPPVNAMSAPEDIAYAQLAAMVNYYQALARRALTPK